MIKIYIHGLKEAEYDINQESEIKSLIDEFTEFVGNVIFNGKIKRIGKRYYIKGIAECKANLICDRSLEEYTETIKAELSLVYIIDDYLSKISEPNYDEPEKERILSSYAQYIDITEDIRQELIVSLPMKRISPKYRNIEIEDCFPEVFAKEESSSDLEERWAELKKIKLN